MSISRNRLLFYYGVPVSGIGSAMDLASVAGILDKFDYVVVKPHTGADLTELQQVVEHYLLSKGKPQFFGHIQYSDLATAQAALAQWQADLTEGLGGVYIEGLDTATRADQNTLVSAAHTANLAVMVEAGGLFNLFDTLNGDVDPLIGRDAIITDYLVIDGFYLQDQNVAVPAFEPVEHLAGRLEYAKGAQTNTSANPVALYNFKILGAIPTGSGATLSEADYLSILGIANKYGLETVGVHSFDRGESTPNYFMTHQANIYVT